MAYKKNNQKELIRRQSRIVDLYNAGKGWPVISNCLDIHQATVKRIVHNSVLRLLFYPQWGKEEPVRNQEANGFKTSLELATPYIIYYTEWLFHANPTEEATALKKEKNEFIKLIYIWSLPKSILAICNMTRKMYFGLVKQWCWSWSWQVYVSIMTQKGHSLPASKHNPCGELQWREHHGVGLHRCLRAWTTYHCREENSCLPKYALV